jgi:hypothetical protein
MWVLKITDGNTLESISIAFKVMLVFLGIDIFLKYRNKKKESGLSEDQLWLQQSGGSPDKLLKHGKIMRSIAYVLVVSSLGFTLYGLYISNVACIVIGGGMCVIFLPCAAFFFWVAYKFISIAKRAGTAQAESSDKQKIYELSANSVTAISEDKKAAAFKEFKRKSIEGILVFLAFSPFMFGLLLFSDSYIEQGYSLTPPQFSQLHEANGIFKSVRSGRSHYFAVDDNQNNRRYSCDSGCGFEGSVEAIGKQAKVLVYKDSIYQLEIDNVVVVDYAKRIKFTSKFINEGIIYTTIGAFLFTLLPIYKWRQRRKDNGK